MRAHDENAGIDVDGPAKSDKDPEHDLIFYWMLAQVVVALIRLAEGIVSDAMGKGAVTSLLIGIMGLIARAAIEWFVLRMYLPGIRYIRWLVAQPIGIIVGAFFAIGADLPLLFSRPGGAVINSPSGKNIFFVVTVLVVTGSVALAEWYVLRRHTALHARWTWVIASAFGATLGTILMILLGSVVGYTYPSGGTLSIQAILFQILSGAILGLATGPVLAEMVRKRSPDTEVILERRKVVK